MTTPADQGSMAWTDEQLDAALADLGSIDEVSRTDLATLRRRIVATASPGLNAAMTSGRETGSRRRRRILAAGAVVIACGVGGATAAAASGVFDQQTEAAFASGNTYPFHIDAHTAVERVSTTTPDGGVAQYWTAKKGNAHCGAAAPGRSGPDDARQAVSPASCLQ